MPNWCENELRFSDIGDFNKVIKMFVEKDGDNELNFCFNKIIPAPEEIKDKNPDNLSDKEYDFRVDNWGTKWEPTIDDIQDMIIYFNTAWCPPIGIIKALKEKHDIKGSMTLIYNEPGCCFAGIFTVNEDGSFNDECYDIKGKEDVDKLPSELQEKVGDWFNYEE